MKKGTRRFLSFLALTFQSPKIHPLRSSSRVCRCMYHLLFPQIKAERRRKIIIRRYLPSFILLGLNYLFVLWMKPSCALCFQSWIRQWYRSDMKSTVCLLQRSAWSKHRYPTQYTVQQRHWSLIMSSWQTQYIRINQDIGPDRWLLCVLSKRIHVICL